jgi:3,4-dihydroxy 2-butanone 4-phosphate synthase/GTP cyclohydrolase II
MARRHDLEIFAQKHQLKIGTIADLIEYRMNTENSITKNIQMDWPTEFGDFILHVYQDNIEGKVHLALTRGKIIADEPTLVRVHITDVSCDLLMRKSDQKGRWTFRSALKKIAHHPSGVVLLLGNHSSSDEILAKLERLNTKKINPIRPQKNERLNESQATRTVGIGSQILLDLGVQKMKLLSPVKKYHSLSGFNLEVVGYIQDTE